MTIRAAYLAAVLSLAWIPVANATIIGSTYNFSTSATGSTQISGPATVATDPANPGFCVGPPLGCAGGQGVSGSFAFGHVSPALETITFTFFGSSNNAPGSFTINLGNFITVDNEVITGITYASGNLITGNFTQVTFNGTNAAFTGTTASSYNAIGGASVVFNVAVTNAPEPSTLLLVGSALLGFGLMMGRRRHRAGRSWNVASSA